jgi:hypothetical protein
VRILRWSQTTLLERIGVILTLGSAAALLAGAFLLDPEGGWVLVPLVALFLGLVIVRVAGGTMR